MKRLVLLLVLLPQLAEATTYYVSTAGGASNNNTCTQAQTLATAKRTIMGTGPTGGGISCLTAGNGDTLIIKTGTYDENLNTNTQTFPSGTSYANAATIKAETGETVVIEAMNIVSGTQYLIFERLIVDGALSTSINELISIGGTGAQAAHHIRLIDMEGKNNSNGQIANVNHEAHHIEFIRPVFHDVLGCGGVNPCGGYCIYMLGSDNLVEGGTFYNCMGYGLHNYAAVAPFPNRNVYRNNVIRNMLDGPGGGAGLLLGSGDGNIAYNNFVYANRTDGIQVSNGAQNSKVYNNSIFGNNTSGLGYGGLMVGDDTGTIVRNNIIYGNTSSNIADSNPGGGNPTFSNNLCNAVTSVNGVQACNQAGNPLFVSSTNLHIQTGSPAIDAALIRPTEFSTDIDGNNRPQGPQWDIGADEFLAPPSNFSVTIPNGSESWQVGTVKTITWSSVITGGGSGSETFDFSGNWVAPAGVTSVQVDAWGGGGGGGGNNTTADGGGGGGGGAFVRANAVTVVPSTSYTVYVAGQGFGGVGAGAATAGEDSYFNTSGTVLAKGGSPGVRPISGAAGAGGAGGTTAASIGDIKFGGGNGGAGRDNATGTGGGGGGSAGLSSAGGAGGAGGTSPGVGGTAGTGAVTGGAGGAGGAAGANGNVGNVPGGGGGGSGDTGTLTGGDGYKGRVILSWNTTANVKIELSRNGGSTWEDIIASTPDDGSYDWTVSGATTTQGRIRISSLAGGGETDTSDANFTIAASAAGTITATSLNGQRFKKGTLIPFGWTFTNVTGNVRIDLSRNGGSTWETIITSTPVSPGTVSWTAETPVSSNCQYRVVSINDPTVSGTSSGNFRIGGSLTLFGQ